MSALWQALYVFWIAGEVVIAIGTRRTAGSANVQDRGTQILLWVIIVLSVTLSGFLRALLPAGFRWHVHWLSLLSVMLFALGLSVRIAAILSLGRSFPPMRSRIQTKSSIAQAYTEWCGTRPIWAWKLFSWLSHYIRVRGLP